MDAQNAATSSQPQHKRDEQQHPAPESRSQSPKKTGEVAATDTTSPTKVKASDGSKRPSPDRPTDHDSDAETVVLPGKDGYSPSKARKVRHEDKRETEGTGDRPKSLLGSARTLEREGSRKREEKEKDRNRDAGSGLSSVPTSPQQRQQRPRRRSATSRASFSDSDHGRDHIASLRASHRERIKPSERLLPHKRKASRDDSDDYEDDDQQSHRPRRQRTTSAGFEGRRSSRDSRNAARDHSTSPQPRLHRRSASTQHANGYTLKKKRLPPPLQPTEYPSDESSANGSPHPRSSKLRSSAADSHASPAKVGTTHRKHLDAHGQTLLARACARGDYDNAKRRLSERHEDLNNADYAGNTPLQIAALHGHTEIVKLLIDEGCILDCFNNDKDTPLLDAVDNGHLDVVKLLLDAGANPRKANVNGEEPIDRITEETDNAEEIRNALMEAKDRVAFQPRTSEERQVPGSPHDSPAMPAAPSRRGGTVRSTKTRNDLLYMPLNEATLRQAAGRGDIETVSRVLQVKDQCDDPESMVAAARGGHDLVIELLLGIGGASPDPRPVSSLPGEYATPILAAIGQENINVLDLLLKQQGFDPTRLYKGKPYYEVARHRQGVNWQEEERKLKDAYNAYQGNKNKSPKKVRERDRDEKRSKREDRDLSPSRERRNKVTSPRERRRTESMHTEDATRKTVPKPKLDDREESPLSPSHKVPKFKSVDSDVAAFSSEGEAHKPRRKLISKGELRGEREKQRRSSMVSTTSSLREPSSPQEPRHDDRPDKTKLSERYHDRTKALKRDDSRDRLSGAGDNASKRHRASLTPDRHHRNEHDDGEGPSKRRRLEGDPADKPKKHALSDSQSRRPSNHDGRPKATPKPRKESDSSEARRGDNQASRSSQGEPVRVKFEERDVDMQDVDVDLTQTPSVPQSPADNEKDKAARKHRQIMAEEAQKRKDDEDAERKRLEKEKEKERKRQQEEAEAKRKKEKEEEARRAAELAKQEAEAAEQKRLEEEKRLKEEEDRKQREEAERKEREEQEKRKREEEEKLRKEREAEEARKKREEEERKERERRERAHKEEMERKRAAEQRRQHEEQERARLEQLPALLRWLCSHSNPKTSEVAKRFQAIQGVRYDTISPEAHDTSDGREQWLLNTQVALLLGEKDLTLSRYTAWERVPASKFAKHTFWKLESQMYALTKRDVFDLGRQLPNYYGNEDPSSASEAMTEKMGRLKQEAKEKFFNMDLFFVKLSDFLYTVPNIAHLRDVRIAVHYRELIEKDSQVLGWGRIPSNYKRDPDAAKYMGFAPKTKYYVNGELVDEDLPGLAKISKQPFEEQRVPRKGLVRICPSDPDYERACVEQHLEHLLNDPKSSRILNGVSPKRHALDHLSMPNGDSNGISEHVHNGSLSNGINGS